MPKRNESLEANFSGNLARARQARGLTYRRLSQLTGLSAPYLYQIEARDRSPTLDTMDRIAKTFKTTVAAMLAAPPKQQPKPVKEEPL